MPITEGLVSRKMCYGPPKQGHLEKRKKKPVYVQALKFNKCHDTKDGKFSSTCGTGGGEGKGSTESKSTGSTGSRGSKEVSTGSRLKKSLTPAQQAMQDELAAQEKKPVHKVKTAEEAVALVLRGENVEIQDTKSVHTVLKALGEMAVKAKALKEDAPEFDPCTITVKGVSLFCTEKIRTPEFPNGIPRIEMPQFKSKNPVPGSEASKLPVKDGEVDATQAFLDHLAAAGVKSNPNGKMLARKLKASQAEMEGAKVAGMMVNEKFNPKKQKITVTRDGYVLDGHHTWAAAVGRDAEDGNLDNDMEMEVVIVDMPMSEVYHLSVEWTKAYGLPAAGIKKKPKTRKQDSWLEVLQFAVA